MIDFLVDCARAVADSLKGSPLWLELIMLCVGALVFFACVALLLVAIAWVVSLPERVGDWWRRRQ